MDNLSSENKVLGIPVEKFVKICYLLILASAGYGAIANVASLVGLYLTGRIIFGLVGLGGVALAATAYVGFKEKFPELDNGHFKFIIVAFVGLFLLAVLPSVMMINFGAVGMIILVLFSLFQLAVFFNGYKAYQSGQLATKDILINNFKNLKNTLKK